MHRKRTSGFTLIELMVASVVSAWVMWAIFLCFDSASKMSTLLEGDFEVRQQARSIFARMEHDLSSAFINSNGDYFIGAAESIQAVTGAPSEGLDGVIYPVTHVFYTMGTYDDEGALFRTDAYKNIAVEDTISASTEEKYLLAENVTGFSVRYWPASNTGTESLPWVDRINTTTQDEPAMPTAVEVTITLKDSKNVVERTFFDIIPIAQGR